AAEDQQVEVDLWRLLHDAGVDQAQFGGEEATEHDHPASALPHGDRGVQGVGDHGEVAAVGQFRGDGVAGRSAVDPDGGTGVDEFGDDAGDRGLLARLDRGPGAVGGGAADGRSTVDPV